MRFGDGESPAQRRWGVLESNPENPVSTYRWINWGYRVRSCPVAYESARKKEGTF
jgi:hypothetical protein